MANRRKLKKEIREFQSELLCDCISYIQFNPKQDPASIEPIINELADNHTKVFSEISKPTNGMTRKEVKERYNQIIKSVTENANEVSTKLSNLPRN